VGGLGKCDLIVKIHPRIEATSVSRGEPPQDIQLNLPQKDGGTRPPGRRYGVTDKKNGPI